MELSLHWRHRKIADGYRAEVFMNFYPEMGTVHLTGFNTLFEPDENVDFAWYTKVTRFSNSEHCACGKCV